MAWEYSIPNSVTVNHFTLDNRVDLNKSMWCDMLCRFLCLVGLGTMGERDRLDGSSRDKPALSIYRARNHLAESFHGE